MDKSLFIVKVGLLKPATTTVECGNHFRKIKNHINELPEEKLIVNVDCKC